MERYKLILAYDGAAFAGSQRQAKRRTVQGELENALRELGWTGRSVTLAGRTDTGVHASGQVAAFDFEWNHGLQRLLGALNANLPLDMAVSAVELVDAKFNPRFDAASRCYRYRLFCREVRDPLREKMAWRVWPAFKEEALLEAAAVFLGRHDFSAFGSPAREQSSTVRTVMASEWSQSDGEWQYEVRADAFLYRMVRRLVFVQVAVAQGRCLKETVVEALERPQVKNEIPAGLAPAHGLTLVEVTY
jgi:tRNA pseudouridine38-40 synthase